MSAEQRDLDERLHTARGTLSNVSNRFFDKMFTLTVDPLGRAGAMGEHSPMDALVPSMVAEYAIVHSAAKMTCDIPTAAQAGWERLDWVIDAKIERECVAAYSRASALISDSDNKVFWFTDYGSDWINESAQSLRPSLSSADLHSSWYQA
jgi:carnitine O-acetyltransferase